MFKNILLLLLPWNAYFNLDFGARKLAITKGDQKCGMDYIFEAQEKGEINEDNVLYMVDNLNTAGMETIVWTMEWVIAELVNHPEIQQKIREEVTPLSGRASQ